MDVRFVNPVLDSITNVLSTMANMQPKAGNPALKTDDRAHGVVTGIIDLKGEQATGSVAISFSKSVALDIAKRMLRMETEELNDMVKDLVGEIANMMAGGAKARLQDKGFDFDLTLPSVLAGEGHQVKHSVNGSTIILPFHTDSGDFFVEICFK
jgi:chemotaxis protein CheX